MNIICEFLKNLSENILSLIIIFLIYHFLKYLVSRYNKKKNYKNLDQKITYIGNKYRFDLINFNGESYIFKFEEIGIVHLNKKDVSIIDILKILCGKSEIILTEKTSYNIVRVLNNMGHIK